MSANFVTSPPSPLIIATSLRNEILHGQMRSGQPLRQDEIAARFGVSKIPVREALVTLSAEGLVTFIRNRGAFVSFLSAAEADELYFMRIALETAILQRAIPHLTIAALDHAAAVLEQIDHESNIIHWSGLNWEFHQTLYRPAGLPNLLQQIKTLHVNLSRYLVLYLSEMDFQSVSQIEHRALLHACRQGAVSNAHQLLTKHLQSASLQLTTFLSRSSPIPT